MSSYSEELLIKFLCFSMQSSLGQEWDGHSVPALLGAVKDRIEGVAVGNYKAFINAYYSFFIALVGIKPQFNATGGKALKRIAAYLKTASKEQTDEGALQSWQYILANWKRLSPFLQQQTSLPQIEKNLNEIITQLKHGHADKSAKREQQQSSISELDRRYAAIIADSGIGGSG